MTTKNPHDSFAKNFFEQLLSPLGEVTVERRIADEPRSIDIFFLPSFPLVDPQGKSISIRLDIRVEKNLM